MKFYFAVFESQFGEEFIAYNKSPKEAFRDLKMLDMNATLSETQFYKAKLIDPVIPARFTED
jgi:orotidine-5'-phosphate decarboxylase